MRHPLRILLLLVTLGAAPSLSAQIVFTATATANSTTANYISGNSYTFVFASGTGFASNSSSGFGASSNSWREEETVHDQLWTTVTGSGLLGSYVRPSGEFDPNSGLTADFVSAHYQLGVWVGTDAYPFSSMGLTALDGTQVSYVSFGATGGNLPSFSFPATYGDPVAYFSSRTGTYTGFSSGLVTINDSDTFTLIQFTVTSVTISAIPESSTYAALFGLGALSLVVLCRRRTVS